MILLLISFYFGFKVLLQGRHHFLLYFLVVLFALNSVPSGIGEYLVLRVGSTLIRGRDFFIPIMFVYFATNERAKSYIRKNWKLAAVFCLIVLFNMLSMGYSWISNGFESSYIRSEFFGVLFLGVCLVELDVFSKKSNLTQLGAMFNIFNCIVLISAILIHFYPNINQRNSELYTSMGWAVDTGSMVYITVIAGDVCLISVFYFMCVLRRFVLHPSILLPVALIGAGSHRITYLALGTLFIGWWGRELLEGLKSKYKMSSVTNFSLAAILVIVGLAIALQTEFFLSAVSPFIERLFSLGDSNNLTIVERTFQYAYFFTDYLPSIDYLKMALGENYLPTTLRDKFYLTVNPHNFIIGTIVAKGVIGFTLVIIMLLYVLYRSLPLRKSLFLIPTFLFLMTQMTDAAFSEFPFSALYAMLLGLMLSNNEAIINIWMRKVPLNLAR